MGGPAAIVRMSRVKALFFVAAGLTVFTYNTRSLLNACTTGSFSHHLVMADAPAAPANDGGTSTKSSMLRSVGQGSVEQQQQHEWPGVPVQELGNRLVQIGSNFVDNSRELLLENYLNDFLSAYENRPDKVNLCGIRINHAYALYIAVRHLKPQTIIESGVNAGQSTYFMRAAAPDAMIFPIDPLDKPICGQEKRWIDSTGNSEYFTGSNFTDFADIDWASRIRSKQIDPDRTLVFLDDHLVVFDRFSTLMKYGFRHVLLEDNYKVGEGATVHDKAGFTPKQMFARVNPDSEFLFAALKSYAEFPPLVPPIMGKESKAKRKAAGGFLHCNDSTVDIVAPVLRPDIEGNKLDQELYQNITRRLGLDPRCRDNESYMQIMNYNQFTYMEVRPMAPRLASKLLS